MKQLYIKVANNFWLCVFIYAATILIAAATFMIIEGFDFNKAVWFSFITSLTIGYGDISPATTLGRVFTILFSIMWILFIIPCFLVNMINIVKRDEDKFTHEEQEQLKMDVMLIKVSNSTQLAILKKIQDRYLRIERQ